MGKTKEQLQKRHLEILEKLDNLDMIAAREERAMNEKECQEYDALLREDNRLQLEMQGMLNAQQLEAYREQKSKSQMLRELYQRCRENRESISEVMHDREAANSTTVLMKPATGNTTANLEASGAIPLVIRPIIDTKVAGLELPDDLELLTGVVGNEVIPYSINDVEFTVGGEVEPVSEQAINFAKLSSNPEHVSAALAISNRAIDNADFDLAGFCEYKLAKGFALLKAKYVYSHITTTHDLKPVFSLVDVEELTVDENIGKNIAKIAAGMWDEGFEGEPELVMDKTVETELRFTKAIPNSAGDRTVIENDRCVGYRYKVSPFVNYATREDGKHAADGNHYIGFGHWRYLSFEQHGEIRMTIDAISAEVAKRNTTVLTMGLDLSLTELSQKVNGNTSGKPQAFKLVKLVGLTSPTSDAAAGDGTDPVGD